MDCLKCSILPQRVLLSIMGFLGVVVTFTMRACLSIAITEMVVPVNTTGKGNDSLICPVEFTQIENNNIAKSSDTKYTWTQEQQGWVLSSFFVGYIVSHVPGGILAEKFGGKWTFSLGILLITICNAVTPQALEYGEDYALYLLIVLRMLMGLGAGPSFPALTVLLAAWVPQNERGKLGTFVYGGGQIGNLISFYLSGIMLSYWSWQVVFYIWSSIAFIWFIAFVIFCFSDPASHPFITKEERDYLKTELGQLKRNNDLPATPWFDMISSVPVVVLILSQIGNDWLFYVLASDLPKYMKDVLGFSVREVGLYSSLPFLPMWIVSILSGFLCDYLIKMVKKSDPKNDTNHYICEALEVSGNSSSSSQGGEYPWTEAQQGFILSSFYIGYVLTHVPGGVIAEKYGGKWTLGLGILSTAIFTLLTPVAVKTGGYIALIVLRILMGLGEGTTFPALSVLLASWVPEKERSKLGSFVFGGGQIGTVVGNLLSGLILHAYSWEYVFYFFGIISVVWFLVFTVICYSDPGSHPFISKEERQYLESELGQLKRQNNLPPTPWISILTSVPMLALVAAQIGHDWGFYIMVSDLPKYMSDVLRFPIQQNAIWSSLPYLVMWGSSVSTGFLSDFLIVRGYVTITGARKWFTGIAAVIPAVFIVLASYAGCERMLVVAYFTLAMGFMGTFYPGMKVNPLDLSPNYAGSLMAVTNGIGALTGVAAPTFVGYMTPNSLLEEWRLVFWVTFGIFVVTTVIYSIWASGEVQPWNYPKECRSSEFGNENNNVTEKQLDSKL